jgi:hypothetical protein
MKGIDKTLIARRSDVFGDTVFQEELGERVEHVVAGHPLSHADGQAFPRELVQHREQTKLAAVTRSLTHEVIGPNVVLVGRS